MRPTRSIPSLPSAGRLLLIAAAGAACVGSAGCVNAQAKGTRYREVSWSLTPELETLDKTYVDVDRQVTTSWKTDIRMIQDDFSRAQMIDRPSRLSPFPIPY